MAIAGLKADIRGASAVETADEFINRRAQAARPLREGAVTMVAGAAGHRGESKRLSRGVCQEAELLVGATRAQPAEKACCCAALNARRDDAWEAGSQRERI